MTTKGVGSPGHLLLNAWGSLVYDVFGAHPYLVGSATTTKEWRDVDVRLMLDREAWERILPSVPYDRDGAGFVYPQWSALCMAFSAWGKDFTGLPIDFQIQQIEWANKTYKTGIRDPLGIRVLWDRVYQQAYDAAGIEYEAPDMDSITGGVER